jgi:hypothetical protein
MSQDTSSPDGRLRIEWTYSSGRMSHEMWAPTVYDTKSGKQILSLGPDSWDASFLWQPDGIAIMHLRHYYQGGGKILIVRIDMAREQFQAGESDWQPISAMQEAVPAEFFRLPDIQYPEPPSGTAFRLSLPRLRIRETRLGLVVLLAVVMIGLLGGCAYLTLEVWRLPEPVGFGLTFTIMMTVGYGLFRLINRS